MKKRSLFINNKNGFILPYTLFITTIVLLVIITNITIYSRDIQTTDKYIELLKIQTLFQMGLEKFKLERNDVNTNRKISYSFPHGDVEINYIPFELEDHLHFSISTKDQSIYRVIHTLKIPQDK